MAILSEVINFNPQYYIFLVHFVKLIQTSLQWLKYCYYINYNQLDPSSLILSSPLAGLP